MSILVGTTQGLFQLGEGSTRPVVNESITALSVGGALSALSKSRTVLTALPGDDPEPIATVPEGLVGRCLLLRSAGWLVGTSDARLLRLTADRVLEPIEGFDAAPGRDHWYTPWGGPPDTRSLAEAADGALYVNVHVGGILRSRDGGETWQPTIDIDTDVHQVLADPSEPGLVVAATAYGLALSEDGGDTWRFETDGLHARYCRAVAIGGDVVYLSASRSHRGEQGAVYRKRLEDPGPFERCTDGLPEWFDGNVDSHCLAAGAMAVAVAAPPGEVFLSTDAGATWSLAASGLDHPTCVALT
jgi:hypothetical protein